MGDGPELFQDERKFDEHNNDQVALIFSNHAFEHKKISHTQAPGLDDSKETDHKHGEFDLLGFVKLAANDARKSEFHHTEEALIVEYDKPARVRVVPQREDAGAPDTAPAPADARQQQQQLQQQDAGAGANPPAAADDQGNDEVTARVVGYKKHTVDHEGRHKHPELLGGIFNIDTDSFTDRQSALVRKDNEERYAEKTTKQESGSVNVGPVPLVYIGDRGTTNYYESKRVKLNPNDYVQTNKGFLPIEE